MNGKNCLLFLFNVLLFYEVLSAIFITSTGVLPLQRHSVAIQFFVDAENKNRAKACKIYTRVRKFCLTDLDKEDCNKMDVYGETFTMIEPSDRKTLTYIYPTLYPHDLVGYCDVIIHYKCSENRNRLNTKIPFDTRIAKRKIHSLLASYISNDKILDCETIDENPLENCSPVKCDLKYNGQRSFYDENIGRCIEIPKCVGDSEKELPTLAYDPPVNYCKDLECPMTMRDIYSISNGLGTVTKSTKVENDVKVKLKSNCSTISQNIFLLKDLLHGKLCPCDKDTQVDFGEGCNSAIFTIIICITSICAVLMSFVCCVNTTVWLHRKWSDGKIEACMRKVRSKFKRTKKFKSRTSRINSEIRNALLREVIVRDIPLELREGVVSVCDRMEKDVRKKKRYRNADLGSQISLQKAKNVSSQYSSMSEDTEKD